MTTTKFIVEKETEKAILFIVGFKYNENSPSVVYGIDGNENLNTGYLATSWVPKSVIDENGFIAEWFAPKLLKNAFGRFNINDTLYQ